MVSEIWKCKHGYKGSRVNLNEQGIRMVHLIPNKNIGFETFASSEILEGLTIVSVGKTDSRANFVAVGYNDISSLDLCVTNLTIRTTNPDAKSNFPVRISEVKKYQTTEKYLIDNWEELKSILPKQFTMFTSKSKFTQSLANAIDAMMDDYIEEQLRRHGMPFIRPQIQA